MAVNESVQSRIEDLYVVNAAAMLSSVYGDSHRVHVRCPQVRHQRIGAIGDGAPV